MNIRFEPIDNAGAQAYIAGTLIAERLQGCDWAIAEGFAEALAAAEDDPAVRAELERRLQELGNGRN